MYYMCVLNLCLFSVYVSSSRCCYEMSLFFSLVHIKNQYNQQMRHLRIKRVRGFQGDCYEMADTIIYKDKKCRQRLDTFATARLVSDRMLN